MGHHNTQGTASAFGDDLPLLGTPVGGEDPLGKHVPFQLNSDGSVIVEEEWVPLTPASPDNKTLGVATSQILAANASRKGLVIINLSSSNSVSLGLGVAAVINKGITLTQLGSVWEMDKETFTTGAINGIASGASTLVSYQEFT